MNVHEQYMELFEKQRYYQGRFCYTLLNFISYICIQKKHMLSVKKKILAVSEELVFP